MVEMEVLIHCHLRFFYFKKNHIFSKFGKLELFWLKNLYNLRISEKDFPKVAKSNLLPLLLMKLRLYCGLNQTIIKVFEKNILFGIGYKREVQYEYQSNTSTSEL